MSVKISKLLSGRVPVLTPTEVPADRYQFLSLGEAEPNLGYAANGSVLTTNIAGSRIWTNVLNISAITLTGNLSTTANVIAGYVRTDRYQWANGAPFLSSSYGNAEVATYLLKNDITIGGNLTVQGNVTIVNTEVVNTTEYATTVIATTVNATTIGNIGANLVGSGQYITGVVASSVNNATTVATANVAIHQQVTSSTTNQAHYLPFYRQLNGNAVAYTNSGLTYNPNNGTLSASYFSGIGALTSLSTTGVSTLGGNVVLISGTPTNDNTTGALVLTGTGGAAIGGNLNINGQIFIGAGAQEAGIVNATLIARGSSDSGAGLQYTQFALFNTTSSGSTDFAAYPNNLSSDQAHGWVDMGITGDAYNDPNYTITKPNDSYVFGSGANATVGGNLVLATDFSGSYNDIIVATGGFTEASEVARFHGNATTSGYLVLKQGTAATSTTTGALRVQGGVGVTGNVWAGNILATGFFYANGMAFVGGGSSVSGATGPAGATGLQGATGATGTPGNNGATGATGLTGATGPAGATGPTGAAGNDGASGAQGATGTFNGILTADINGYGHNISNINTITANTITANTIGDVSANVGTVFTRLNTLSANVGSYESWANVAISSLYTDANANVSAYLAKNNITIGNLNVGNITIDPAAGISASGSFGNVGEYLLSTGSSTVQWANKFYVGATPPPVSYYGDIWFYVDPVEGIEKLYMWVNDGGSDFYYDFLPPSF